MGQYTGFNLFGTLTLQRKIGDFYLSTKIIPLTRLTESDFGGQFTIHGRL